MKELSKLYELFGDPLYTTNDCTIWSTPEFYSIYYNKKTIYISTAIDDRFLSYPLNHNVSYSHIKQLLVVQSKTVHEVLYSILLALGITADYELSEKELHELLTEQIRNIHHEMMKK